MTDDEEFIAKFTALRIAGKHRKEIAEELDISLAEVKRTITKHAVVSRKTRKSERDARKRKHERPRYASIDDGVTLMDKAKQVLGDRMGEDHRGYLLDKRPASSWQVLDAAGLRKPA